MKAEMTGHSPETATIDFLSENEPTVKAHQKILKNREQGKIKGILVEHADAEASSLGRMIVFDGPAIEEDGAGGLGRVSRKNLHEGAFARTIFPQDSVDGPLREFQVDPVVGIHLPVLLANVLERNPQEILFEGRDKPLGCRYPRLPVSGQVPATER